MVEKAGDKMAWADSNVTFPQGFSAYGTDAGLIPGRADMALLWSSCPAVISGVFTTNAAKASPVLVTREVVNRGICQAFVINAGNANAVTGEQGIADALKMQQAAAQGLDVDQRTVGVASTGVIGVPLPMPLVERGIAQLLEMHAEGRDSDGVQASEAILTTDREPKALGCLLELPGGTVRLGMMVKGSGMIHPQMATMLAFFTTDGAVAKPVLDAALRYAVQHSFHQLSVDGDSSTNDMAVVLANGASGIAVQSAEAVDHFRRALALLARQAARMIAADGEGASHLLTVRVSGAPSDEDAARKARAVVSSNLVKSAVYGQDPNWGRIIAALGRAGEAFCPDEVSLSIGGVTLLDRGNPVAGSEQRAQQAMQAREVVVGAVVGHGSGSSEAWGCDLTEQYVEINAHYRT
jgi:glutamate N-acetyltransferase/amino-acid N-acetyltransferase